MARAARVLLYALVVWAPLPLGSNRAIFWVINACLASASLVLFMGGELAASRQRREFNWRPAVWIALAITVWALWMVVQAVPYTPAALHHPIWQDMATSLPDVRGAISINPSTTWATIAEFVPIVFLGLVAMRLANHPRRVELLLTLIVGTSVLVAVYGLAAHALGFERVVWLDDASFEGFLTGTFIGRSAAATYFAIGLCATAGLTLARLEAVVNRRGDDATLTAILPSVIRAVIPGVIAGAVLAVALLNTGSRGGIGSAAIGLAVIALLSLRKDRVSRRTRLLVPGLSIVGLVVVATLSSGVLLDRLAAGVLDDNRLLVYQDTIRMILSRPWLGQGAGTFVDAFPLFNTGKEVGIVWLRTHNSYLQGAAELGLPVFLMLVITILAVMTMVLRGVLRSAAVTPAAVAAVGAAAAIAVQSLVDFSMQIQAITLTLVVLTAAGLGEVKSVARKRAATAEVPPASGGDPSAFTKPAYSGGTRLVTVKIGTNSNAAPPDASIIGRIADGKRVYVFGDVHGRLDLLTRLRQAITADSASAPPELAIQVVGLGDYIDRGPSSRGVIEALATNFFGLPSRFLRGNHEQMLLDFLDDPAKWGPVWFRNGAIETVRSYDDSMRELLAAPQIDFVTVRDRLADAMPARHLDFLKHLPTRGEEDGYFFAHAGARPGVPLSRQLDHDLIWIREGFADRDARFEKMIVHGHTAVDQPYFGSYRINLDTGAYFTGRLCCLVIEGMSRRLLPS